MVRPINVVLSVVLIFSVFLIWNLEPDPTEPNVQFIPEMHYSVPYNAQSVNPVTADGKTLQIPPVGTVARGHLPLLYSQDEVSRARAGRDLVSPVDPDSNEAQERGSLIYLRYCQPCHGSTGEGNGVVTRYGFPPPPSLGTLNVLSLKDGEVFHTITFGKGNMPSLASQVGRSDRWTVILKVRSLQQNILRTQRTTSGTSTALR